jgi:hypothetical protein
METEMNKVFDSALEAFVEVLEKLNIAYAIGGSVASSIYGQVRFTQNADVSVAGFGSQIETFCKAIESSFYVSSQAVKQAHANASSFNVIHLETAFKIDAFVVLDDPFKRQVLMRRKKFALEESSDRSYDFVTPEDIVLLKMQWFLEGGLVSEKQWSDILGVLKNRQHELDIDYMRDWASKLSLSDLLDKALQQIKE